MSRIPLYLAEDLARYTPAQRRHSVCVAMVRGVSVGDGWADVVVQPPTSPFRRHNAGCACCVRDGLTVFLGGLFQERVRGLRQFEAIVLEVMPSERDDVRGLLRQDALLAARYVVQDEELKEAQ